MNTIYKDVNFSVSRWRYWLLSSFLKFQSDYKKSALGVIWEPISLHFVACVLSLIWPLVLKTNNDISYFLHVLFGIALWQLMNKLVERCGSSIKRNTVAFQNKSVSLSSVALEELASCFFRFVVIIPFLLIWAVIVNDIGILQTLTFFYGLTLILATALGFALTFGIIAFFTRDLLQLINSLMRLGFLITPIIWRPERLGEQYELLYYNPFFSYMELCRASLMNQKVDPACIIITHSIAATLLIISAIFIYLYTTKIKKEAFRS